MDKQEYITELHRRIDALQVVQSRVLAEWQHANERAEFDSEAANLCAVLERVLGYAPEGKNKWWGDSE